MKRKPVDARKLLKQIREKERKTWDILIDVDRPRNGFVPLNYRNIFGKHAKKCKWIRKDPEHNEVFNWCVNRKVFDLTEFRMSSNIDIGLECSPECPYFEIGIKAPIPWVHRNGLRYLLGSPYPKLDDRYYRGYEEIKGHHIVLAYIGENKWIMTTYITCKLKGYTYIPYSKKMYDKLVAKRIWR